MGRSKTSGDGPDACSAQNHRLKLRGMCFFGQVTQKCDMQDKRNDKKRPKVGSITVGFDFLHFGRMLVMDPQGVSARYVPHIQNYFMRSGLKQLRKRI